MLFRTIQFATSGILTAMLLTLGGCGGGSPADAPAGQAAVTSGGPTVLGGAPSGTPTPLPDGPVGDVLRLVAAAPAIKTIPKDLNPDLQTATKDIGSARPGRPLGCLVDPPAVVSPDCVFGDPHGSRTLVLLGDSHAAMWITGFDKVGTTLHWKVVLLAKQACPAVSLSISRANTTGAGKSFSRYPECEAWLDYAISRTNSINPDLVVVTNCSGCQLDIDGHELTKSVWSLALQRTLNRITISRAKKVVLSDVPRLKLAGADCLAAHESNVQSCSVSIAVGVGALYNDAERTAATAAGAQYIDVIPWFCSSVCTNVTGNMVTYVNEGHVSGTYAAYLSDVLIAVLQPIMESPN